MCRVDFKFQLSAPSCYHNSRNLSHSILGAPRHYHR